jgi:hypothetical protein
MLLYGKSKMKPPVKALRKITVGGKNNAEGTHPAQHIHVHVNDRKRGKSVNLGKRRRRGDSDTTPSSDFDFDFDYGNLRGRRRTREKQPSAPNEDFMDYSMAELLTYPRIDDFLQELETKETMQLKGMFTVYTSALTSRNGPKALGFTTIDEVVDTANSVKLVTPMEWLATKLGEAGLHTTLAQARHRCVRWRRRSGRSGSALCKRRKEVNFSYFVNQLQLIIFIRRS